MQNREVLTIQISYFGSQMEKAEAIVDAGTAAEIPS